MLECVQSLDEAILLWMRQWMRCDFMTYFMIMISTLGNAGIVWIAVSVVLLFTKRYRKAGVIALCALLICYVTNDLIIKLLVARPRPFESMTNLDSLIHPPASFSFPSGHTVSSFAAAGVFYRYLKKARIPFIVFAVLMGFSRMYLGVHYPSDVFVGMLLGIAGSQVVCYLSEKVILWYVKRRE